MTIKLFLICISLSVTSLISAQPHLNIAREKSKTNYLEASVEYERVLFTSNNQAVIDTAILEKTRLLLENKLFIETDDFITRNINLIADSSIAYQVYTNWLLNLYLKNNLDGAVSLVSEIETFYTNKVDYKWINFLKMLIYNEKQEWKKTDSIYKEFKNKLIKTDSFGVSNLLQHQPKLLKLNKGTILSYIIPGGGQFYAKKPLEGLTNVALQTLCLAYTIVCYNSGLYLSSWLIGGGLFGSFRFGSTRRTETLIKQYNLKLVADYNTLLKYKLIEVYKNL